MHKKLNYIDALRGIAVLCVVATHVGLNSLTGIAHKASDLGAKGVELFYFVSAFTLFLSSKSRLKEDHRPILNFTLRRLFRIAPLYYLAIVYYALVMPYLTLQKIKTTGVLLNFSFLHGFSPDYINTIVPGGWSIAIEMLFYVLVPILVSRITSFKNALLFLIITVIIKFLFNGILSMNPFYYDPNTWSGYLYWYLPNQMPSFAFGILFYFITKEYNSEFVKNNFKFIILTTVIISALFILNAVLLQESLVNVDFFFGIAFLALALTVRSYNYKIIVNGLTQFIGKLSFSMYLIHFAVIYWLSNYNVIHIDHHEGLKAFLLAYLVVLLFTSALSYISYKYIEVPMQLVGKRIIDKIENNGGKSIS